MKMGISLLAKLAVEVNSSDNLVISENKERLVVMIGVDDLIVVDTPDALLVCRREDAQQVRLAVNQLRQSGHLEYL